MSLSWVYPGVSKYKINAIVTRALVDPVFTQAILNGQRRQKLLEFELPPELVDVIISLKGNDIHQFIYQLHQLTITEGWNSPETEH